MKMSQIPLKCNRLKFLFYVFHMSCQTPCRINIPLKLSLKSLKSEVSYFERHDDTVHLYNFISTIRNGPKG